MTQLSEHIHVRHLVLLDGDQRGRAGELPNLAYLPVPEVEDLFIRDAAAVRAGLAEIWQEEQGEGPPSAGLWEPAQIERYLADRASHDPRMKGSKLLIDLCHDLGFKYKKAVHGPVIAKHLDPATLADMRPILGPLFS